MQAEQALYWRETEKGLDKEAVVLQMVATPDTYGTLPPLKSLSWSEVALDALRNLQSSFRDVPGNGPKYLPYRSLRGALEACLDNPVLVHAKLGDTWKVTDGKKAMPAVAMVAGDENLEANANRAVKAWCDMVLSREGSQYDAKLVETLTRIAEDGEAFSIDMMDTGIRSDARLNFPAAREAVLLRAAYALSGLNAFGLSDKGGLIRSVRSDASNNSLEFLTWPIMQEGSYVSGVLRVTAATAPWTEFPLLTFDVSKRRWCPILPSGGDLFMQKSVNGTLLIRDRLSSIGFSASIRDKVIQPEHTPAFALGLLKLNGDFSSDLEALMSKSDDSYFLGIPVKTTYRKVLRSVGAGAGLSTTDAINAFSSAVEALAPYGMEPVPLVDQKKFKALETLGNRPVLKGIHLKQALDASPDIEVSERLREEIGKIAASQESAEPLETFREKMRSRLQLAYGDAPPVVQAFVQTPEDGELARLCIRAMFGDALTFETDFLPENTHGPYVRWKGKRAQRERFDAVMGAWRPTAEAWAKRAPEGPRLSLVIAPNRFEILNPNTGKTAIYDDDNVSKPAGRAALAHYADASSQFLVPWGRFPSDKLSEYLHRIQAAACDLLFGHAGLVRPVKKGLETAFPSEDDRPTCIVSLSRLRRNEGSRHGGDASDVLVATRLDVTEGRCLARSMLGWKSYGAIDASPWEPQRDALRRLATTPLRSTGQNIAEKARTLSEFVCKMLDGLVAENQRPLLIVDFTNLSGMWKWLSDKEISGPFKIGEDVFDPSMRWPGLRIVRLRTGIAPRLAHTQHSHYEPIRADGSPADEEARKLAKFSVLSSVARIGALDVGRPHYVLTASYSEINSSAARGMSQLEQPEKMTKIMGTRRKELVALEGNIYEVQPGRNVGRDPYRRPVPLDATVALAQPGDDPDRIALLLAWLRSGYGHTDAHTFLPMPLFFKKEMRNQMSMYILEEEENEFSEEEEGAGGASHADSEDGADDADGENSSTSARLCQF